MWNAFATSIIACQPKQIRDDGDIKVQGSKNFKQEAQNHKDKAWTHEVAIPRASNKTGFEKNNFGEIAARWRTVFLRAGSWTRLPTVLIAHFWFVLLTVMLDLARVLNMITSLCIAGNQIALSSNLNAYYQIPNYILLYIRSVQKPCAAADLGLEHSSSNERRHRCHRSINQSINQPPNVNLQVFPNNPCTLSKASRASKSLLEISLWFSCQLRFI